MHLFPLFFFMLACTSSITYAQLVSISISQDGEEFSIQNHRIQLKKEAFDLNICFKNKIDRLYLNASLNDNYYQLEDSDSTPNAAMLYAMAVAEYPFNMDHSLFVGTDFFHALQKPYSYDGNKMHRFNRIKVKLCKACGIRTVRKITVAEKDYSLEKITKPLYLYIAGVVKKKKKDSQKAIQYRWKVKIEWLD